MRMLFDFENANAIRIRFLFPCCRVLNCDCYYDYVCMRMLFGFNMQMLLGLFVHACAIQFSLANAIRIMFFQMRLLFGLWFYAYPIRF